MLDAQASSNRQQSSTKATQQHLSTSASAASQASEATDSTCSMTEVAARGCKQANTQFAVEERAHPNALRRQWIAILLLGNGFANVSSHQLHACRRESLALVLDNATRAAITRCWNDVASAK